MAVPTTFADFLLAEDSSYINSANRVTEAVTYRSWFWKRLMSGKSREDILQGGKSIKSFIQLDDQGSAHFYGIGDEESPNQPQTVTAWEMPWRFLRGDMSWDDETVKLNTAGLGRTARHKVYFDFKRQIEQACWIDKFKLMERAVMGTPSSNHDSTTAGTDPMPILGTFIADTDTTNTLPAGLTTIQGISPATKTNWKSQSETFPGGASLDPDTLNANDQLLKALSKMAKKVRFDGLPAKQEFSDRATMPSVIVCSMRAHTLLEDLMRQTQDAFVYVGRQDPTYPKPTIFGVPVEWLDYLESATLFNDGSSGFVTEDSTSANIEGPRYFFCNLQDVTPVFHAEMYMEKHPVLTPYRQPSRHTIYVDTYYNIVGHNRRTQGCVGPAATVGSTGDYNAY